LDGLFWLNSDSIPVSQAVNSRSLSSSRVKALLGCGLELASVSGTDGTEGGRASSTGVGRVEGADGASFEVPVFHHHPIAYRDEVECSNDASLIPWRIMFSEQS
jgi:hypothetical protein